MSDVLSQSEIDALLSAISSGDVDAATIRDEANEPRVRTFDFRRPSKFSKEQLRTLEMLHDNFCRLVQNQLSAQLRTVVELTVVSADQVTYDEFVRSMPVPTLINIITLEPLEGNAIFEVNLPLAFSIIDRLAGGPGTHRPKLRELTEIETVLMRGVAEGMLRALTEAWSAIVPVEFRPVGTEMNPQFAQVVAPSDMVVLITFEAHVGAATGMMSLCIPYLVLEPAIAKFSAQTYFSGKKVENQPQLRQEIAHELGGVEVPVTVELGSAGLMVSDLLALAPGDVVPLDIRVGGDVTVSVAGRRAFRAQPGVQGRRMAVQITGQIDDVVAGAC
ncbi:MAG: flagellar motor switch protein FliM [Actinomycetota bacterium]